MRQADSSSKKRLIASGALRIVTVAAALGFAVHPSFADEGGVSFWLPGLYGSLAAAPATPGWALASIYYHTSVTASGNVAAAREITINRFSPTVNVNLSANLNANADLLLVNPSYTFASPVLGGQLQIGVAGIFGRNSVGIDGALTVGAGNFAATRFGSLADSITGVGDLYPTMSLRWNAGVHNFMTYITGDAPVGDYNAGSLANIGIGHGAIDGGAGYTYFNPATGHEFSMVGGFTYNFLNEATQYRNGIDFHLDWGASQFLSKQLFVGLTGYVYDQVTADQGALPILGGFESRVIGIGPQLGYIFPIGGMQGYLNVKAYGEFDAANRPSGWNTWLTFAISPEAPTAASATPRHMVTK